MKNDRLGAQGTFTTQVSGISGQKKQTVKPSFNPRKYERPGFPIDQIVQMKQAFDFFDKDKSGSLQLKEIKSAMQILGFISGEEGDLIDLLGEMDQNGDENLDFEEFLGIMFANISEKDTDQDLKTVFQYFLDLGNQKQLFDDDEEDNPKQVQLKSKLNQKKNKNGKHQIGNSNNQITIQMLRNIAREIGEDVDDEDLVEMLERADKDDDGQVGFSDFKHIIRWKNLEEEHELQRKQDKTKAKRNNYTHTDESI